MKFVSAWSRSDCSAATAPVIRDKRNRRQADEIVAARAREVKAKKQCNARKPLIESRLQDRRQTKLQKRQNTERPLSVHRLQD